VHGDTLKKGSDSVVVNPVPNSYYLGSNLKLITVNGRDYQVTNNDTLITNYAGSDTSGYIVYIESVSNGDIFANLVGRSTKAQSSKVPKNEIIFSSINSMQKDTTLNSHTYRLNNLNDAEHIVTFLVDAQSNIDSINIPKLYPNGVTCISNLAYGVGSLIRVRIAISDSVNDSLGSTKIITQKGKSDTITFAASDSINKNYLLETSNDTEAVKVGDTVIINNEKVAVSAANNKSIYLTPVDTASNKVSPNTFATSNLGKNYITPNNDTLNFTIVNGDSAIVTDKKNGGGSYTIGAKQGTTVTLSDGSKINFNSVFSGEDKNGNPVNYIKLVDSPSTNIIGKIVPINKPYNRVGNGKLFNLKGQCLGELNNTNDIARKVMNSPKGIYLIKYPDGTASKYIKEK